MCASTKCKEASKGRGRRAKKGKEVIFQTRKAMFDQISNDEKRAETDTTRNGVFIANFEMFENVVKHCLECLIYLLNRN